MKRNTFSLKDLLLLVISLGLCCVNSGCALKTDNFTASINQPPIYWVNLEKEQNYQTSTMDISRLEWWKSFEDPDLVNLIEQGLASNYDIAQATNRIRQAQEKLNSVRVNKNPSVDARINSSKATSSEESGLGRTSSVISTQFQTSWEMDLFGKFQRDTDAAEANVQLEIASMNGIKVKLISTIVESYITFRATTEEIKLNQEAADYLREFVKLAELEVQVGLKSIKEVQTAKIQLSNLEQSLRFFGPLQNSTTSVFSRVLPGFSKALYQREE